MSWSDWALAPTHTLILSSDSAPVLALTLAGWEAHQPTMGTPEPSAAAGVR